MASADERKTKDKDAAVKKICCLSAASFRFFSGIDIRRSEADVALIFWPLFYQEKSDRVIFSGIDIRRSEADVALIFWSLFYQEKSDRDNLYF